MKQKIVIHKRSGKQQMVTVTAVPVVTNAVTGETAVVPPPPARYWLHQLCREECFLMGIRGVS